MFTKFEEIFAELQNRGARKRMIAAWGVDSHTIAAAGKAVDLGLVDVTLVGEVEYALFLVEQAGTHQVGQQQGAIFAAHMVVAIRFIQEDLGLLPRAKARDIRSE